MRKMICIGLCLLMIAGVLPATAKADTWIDHVDYTYSDSNADGYSDTVTVKVDVGILDYWWDRQPSWVTVQVKLFPPGTVADPMSIDFIDVKSYTWNKPSKDCTISFVLNLTTSDNSGIGSYSVLIEETNDDAEGARSDTTTRYPYLYPLNMTGDFLLATDNAQRVIGLGQQAVYAISLVNKGPIGDTFSISVRPPSMGWTATSDRADVFVTPLGSATFNVTAKAPDTYSGNMLFVTLVVSAQAATTLKTQNISLKGIIGLVDLSVTQADLDLSSPDALAGLPVKLRANIFNIGTVNASSVVVRFMIDGKPVGDTTVAAVASGGGHAVAEQTWIPAYGSWNLTVSLDPDNTIGEFDRTNNNATFSLSVLAPDLAVSSSDITIIPTSLQAGTVATIRAVVHNIGTANVSAATVRLTIGNFTQDQVIANLSSGGGTAGVNFTWTAVGGSFVLNVSVVPPNTVTEITDANDMAGMALRVNKIPAAAINASTLKSTVGKNVAYSASASSDPDGTVAGYYFDFGDGSNSSWLTAGNITHTYKKAGQYTVRLKVRDNDGAESPQVSATVTIGKKPETKKQPGFEVLVALVAVGMAMMALGRRRTR